jgi:hypothetical protein
VTTIAVLDGADARDTKKLAGTYTGTTQEGGTVSFRLTRQAKIAGFTLTNATLYCHNQVPTEDFPYYNPDSTKTVTVTHSRMPMRGVSRRHPLGKKFLVSDPHPEDRAFQGGVFKGSLTDMTDTPTGGKVVGRGFKGETTYATANGPAPFPSSANPTPQWAPGTEWCITRPIDWTAKKPGTPGFVPTPRPAGRAPR